MNNEEKKVSDSLVKEMIDYLEGTILHVSDACQVFGFEENDMVMSQLEMLDERIFCCAQCGWWYDRGEDNEFDDDHYCDSCIEDVNGDDEEEDW